MRGEYFYNADGEMLIVPQQGALSLRTEFGVIDVAPGEVAVIPRGAKFAVDIVDSIDCPTMRITVDQPIGILL